MAKYVKLGLALKLRAIILLATALSVTKQATAIMVCSSGANFAVIGKVMNGAKAVNARMVLCVIGFIF